MAEFVALNETTQLGVDRVATSPVALALYRNLLAAAEGKALAGGLYGWRLNRLGVAVASAAAAVDFTSGITTDYDAYLLTCTKVIPATDATDLWLRASTDGGSSFLTTNAYSWSRTTSDSSGTLTNTGSAGTSDQIVLKGSLGNATSEFLNLTVWLMNLPDTAVFKGVHAHGMSLDSAATHGMVLGAGGVIRTNSAVNGLRVMMSAGNINGNFALYGLRAAP